MLMAQCHAIYNATLYLAPSFMSASTHQFEAKSLKHTAKIVIGVSGHLLDPILFGHEELTNSLNCLRIFRIGRMSCDGQDER